MGAFGLVLTQQVLAEAPVRAVWEAFADIESWPRWNSVCRSVRIINGTPWEPGFRFHMVLRMAGLPVSFEPVVLESERAHHVVWSSRRYAITGRRTFTFTDTGDGKTLVTDEKEFSSPLLPVRLFYPRPVIRRMSESWLDSLAREAARRKDR